MSKKPRVKQSGVTFMIDLLRALEGEESDEIAISEDYLQAITDRLENDPSEIDIIVDRLDLMRLISTHEFFNFITKASFRLRSGAAGLLGRICEKVYNSASDVNKKILRDDLLGRGNFFIVLGILPSFIGKIAIDNLTLEEWILAIRSRLGNDGASSGLWLSLRELANSRSHQALWMVKTWMVKRPDADLLEMTSALLGFCRVFHPEETKDLDNMLIGHSDDQIRKIFHRSLIFEDGEARIADDRYIEVVKFMEGGTPSEKDELIKFITSTVGSNDRTDKTFALGVNLLHEQIARGLPPMPRGWYLNAAYVLDGRCCDLGLLSLLERIDGLLPIHPKDGWAWHEIAELIKYIKINKSKDVFKDFIFKLASNDGLPLSGSLKDQHGMHALFKDVDQADRVEIVNAALTSLDGKVRHFGLSLFQAWQLEDLPDSITKEWGDRSLAILIFQIQTEISHDIGNFPFLWAIRKRVNRGGDSLRELYLSELIYQMKNLPGSVMEFVKNRMKGKPKKYNSLVESALRSSEEYFEKLASCWKSPINSMDVSGYRRASNILNARRGRQIAKASEEQSVFMAMASKAYLLYGGGQWQTYSGGLGQVSSTEQFSHSVEIPRLHSLDPDGARLRAFNASFQIGVNEKLDIEESGGDV